MSEDRDEFHRTTQAPNKVPDRHHRKDEILGGRYRILSFLGQGGMGVVYKVEQIFLGKELALKTIDTASQSDAAIRRFQAEARAVFAVNHPNIVSVHDFGLLDDQTPFLAMEFVEGNTLGELIQARALPYEDALSHFIQVCFGLAHAHKMGVVHRDIKPGNIMIASGFKPGTEGSIKILDFGIAKMTQQDDGKQQALTRTGEIFGSPAYMSPEQCSGGNVDYRTDIYALGCVIFEALTGTPPFVGESALSTMMMHQSAAVPTLKEASLGIQFAPELELVVQAMLAKSPEHRYQDLMQAAKDLTAIKSGNVTNLSISRKPLAVEASKRDVFVMTKRQFFKIILSVSLISIVASGLLARMWWEGNFRAQITPEKPPAPSLAEFPESTSADFTNVLKHQGNEIQASNVNDASMMQLKGYENLQIFDIGQSQNNELTDKGLDCLDSSDLIHYKFYQCDIKSVDSIIKQKYVTVLDLRETKVTDEAMPKLLKMKMLQTLNLTGTKISEDGIRHLYPATALKCLILTDGAYKPAFINELHRKIPQVQIKDSDVESPLAAKEKELVNKSELEKHTRMLELSRAANPNSSTTAMYLRALALDSIGNESAFRKYIDESIQILERNGDDATLGVVYMDLARYESGHGHPARALVLSDKLLTILPKTMLHSKEEFYSCLTDLLGFAQLKADYGRALRCCDVGIKWGETYPAAAKTRLINFLLIKARTLFLIDRRAEAVPVLEKLLKMNYDFYTDMVVRITYAHCIEDTAKRKQIYDACIAAIESNAYPDSFDLSGHYCDACEHMNLIYQKENNQPDTIRYLQKELDCLENHMNILANDKVTYQRKLVISKGLAHHLKLAGRLEDAKALTKKYSLNWEEL